MVCLHMPFGLRFSVIIFIIFLSVVDGVTAKNVALRQRATQISTSSGPASSAVDAVDGNVDTASCTQDAAGPWWAVDLGQDYSVSHVTITFPNATGDSLSGLDYFRVGMPDSLPYVGSGVRPDSYQLCADSSRHTVSASKVLSVKCNNTVTSRYVIVQSLDTTPERLCLAEVAVYPADDCLSTDKTAVQVSDDTEADRPAGLAVDFGNQSTYSCTDSLQGLPWWAVDLGEASAISHVILTLPSVSGDDLNGLNHFQVGFTTSLPSPGVSIRVDSYTVCGTWNDVVFTGLEIRVDCSTPVTETFQYVIVQSLDTSAEKLCIADICVYAAAHATTWRTTHKTTAPQTSTKGTSSITTTTTTSEATTAGSTDQLLLGLLLGIGTAIIICAIILIICCFWHSCPLYGRCHRKAARQRRDESATVNSQPLSEIINRQPTTTTYEPLDVRTMMVERPDSYEHPVLPPATEGNYEGLVLPDQTAERHNTYDADGYATVIG